MILHPLACEWQSLIDWAFRQVSEHGEEWMLTSAGGATMQAVSQFIHALKGALGKGLEREIAGSIQGHPNPWSHALLARVLRCEAELSMIQGRRPSTHIFSTLDRLLEVSEKTGVLEYSPEGASISSAGFTSVLNEAGILAMLNRAYNESISSRAFSMLVHACRRHGPACVSTQERTRDSTMAVNLGNWGITVRPVLHDESVRSRIFVASDTLLEVIEKEWRTLFRDGLAGDQTVYAKSFLRDAWSNMEDVRNQRRMRAVARLEIVFGRESTWMISRMTEAEESARSGVRVLRGSLLDTNQSGSGALIESTGDDIHSGTFCAVRIEGEQAWSGAVLVHTVPASWRRDGKTHVGLKWLNDFLRPARLSGISRRKSTGQ